MQADIQSMPIQDILSAWGRWQAMNKPENGYPHIAAFARDIVNPGDGADNVQRPTLPDDVCARVDSIVSGMKSIKPTHHKILVAAYAMNMRDHQIARHVKFPSEGGKLRSVGKTWVASKRENAEFWVEAKILPD